MLLLLFLCIEQVIAEFSTKLRIAEERLQATNRLLFLCIDHVIAEFSTKLRIAEEHLQATNRGE